MPSIFSFPGDVTDANVAVILTKLNDAGLLLPFLVLLSTEDKKRIQKMGTKSEGYVDEINQAAIAFPDAIPPANPQEEFEAKIALYHKLTLIWNALGSFYQQVGDTRSLLGSELLATSNVYYKAFKSSSKSNTAMAETLANIANIFKKGTYTMPVIHNIASSGVLTIKNVATGTQLVNKGMAIVSFKASSELTSKLKEPSVMVDPMSSATIPKGWTSIEVTNLSSTNAATISIRMKK